jgi:oxygen-dependent protoporphyrinogen oxidase
MLGIPATAEALDNSTLFTASGRVRIAAERDLPRRLDTGDESIADFFERRFGADAVATLADPLLAGIHMGDARRLSIRALFPALAEAEREHGSVLRALAGKDAGARLGEGPFRALRGGMADLPAALARALPDDTVISRAPVRQLEGRGPFTIDAGPRARIEARTAILAVPAFTAGEILAGVDPEAAALCRAVRYESSATVVLAYRASDVGRPLRGSGFVVAPSERDVRITAGTIISSKWPDRAPPGYMLVRAFFGGSRDPGAMACTDAELTAAAHHDLSRLLAIDARASLVRVYRWPNASPQYDVGHLDRVAKLAERLGRIPGLYVAGSGFNGTGIADCVADGRRAARRAIADATTGAARQV